MDRQLAATMDLGWRNRGEGPATGGQKVFVRGPIRAKVVMIACIAFDAIGSPCHEHPCEGGAAAIGRAMADARKNSSCCRLLLSANGKT